MIQVPTLNDARTAGRHLSFSAVRLYQNCSLRHYFKYVAGIPEETVSASLVFGEAIHAGIGHHFEQVLAGGPLPSLDILLDVFWTTWRGHDHQQVQLSRGDDLSGLGKLAERLFRAFQASEYAQPRGTILGVEEELSGTIMPGVPRLVGRVDLLVDVGDALELTDLKTSRSAWSSDQVQNSADQLLLYHELIKDLADGRPIRLAFLVLTKGKVVSLARHEVVVDRRQIQRTLGVIERVWRAIEAGHVYPSPSPMQCPTCPYRAPCRSWCG